MTPPIYKTKKIQWQIESRDLAHEARVYHLWFPLYKVGSLEDAKHSLYIKKKNAHSPSKEFRIVRVETIEERFEETVWQGLKNQYIIAMNNIEIIPLFNSNSQEWEIRECDENDNTLEVYGFATEEEAEKFVDEWLLA